jgi:hypothetical protein
MSVVVTVVGESIPMAKAYFGELRLATRRTQVSRELGLVTERIHTIFWFLSL